MGERQFFWVTLQEPELPGEASLDAWLYANGFTGNGERAVLEGCVHAWLTAWMEAGGALDVTEPLAELEQK